jgi:hypothetical protein
VGRFLFYAVPVVVTLYAIIDCILTPRALTRGLPKWVWLIVLLLVPFLGAIGWLVAGRPRRETSVASGVGARIGSLGRSRGPVAPDDDPSFLRKLDDDAWSRRMRARREEPPKGSDSGPAAGPTDSPSGPTER